MATMEPLDTNVLIIEPDETFTASVRAALPQHHFFVESAANGTDAWMILATFKHQFDIILLELSLPDLDGLELLTKIRRSPKNRATPVVICSARTHRDEVAAVIRAGISHYFVKPCAADTVAQKLIGVIAAAHPAVA